MNAQEAREATQAKNEHPYKDVMKAITQAVNKGEFTCWYYKVIPDATIKILERDGYTVTPPIYDRGDVLVRIEW